MKLILFKRLRFSSKRSISLLSVVIVLLNLSNCTENPTTEKSTKINKISIVPSPAKILYKRGEYKLDKTTKILLNLSDEISKKSGKYLISKILEKTSFNLKIADRFTTKKINSSIQIILGDFKHIKPEGYKIVISNNHIKIIANDLSGVQYASDVILDLFHKSKNGWITAQVSIEDYPKTKIRGVFINCEDTLIDKSHVLHLLKKNRINYLITRQNWELPSNSLLNNRDAESLSLEWNKNYFTHASIKSFYADNNHSEDSIIFEINDVAMLHPDSLAILGEAMWTKTSQLDYKKIINHLESELVD